MDFSPTVVEDDSYIFTPELGDQTLTAKSIPEIESIIRRLRKFQASTYITLDDEFASHFDYKDVLLLEPTRQKYKSNNHLFTNYRILCFREIPSPPHSLAARTLENALITAVTALISPTQDTTIWPWGNGMLSLTQFCGEPDGALIFPGAQKPFAVIEAGVSDTQRKTNSRTEHWLRKAGGNVKLGISIKVQKSHRVLNSLTITPYWFSTDPSDVLTARSTDHGRDLVKGPTIIKLPVDAVQTSAGSPQLVLPVNKYFHVDCSQVLRSVAHVVQAGM